MLKATAGKIMPTTITGSLPRPHWFVQNLQGRPFSVAMTDIAFREQYTDAVAAYLSDQMRAGLDLLTDGDARCGPRAAQRLHRGHQSLAAPRCARGGRVHPSPLLRGRGPSPVLTLLTA